MSGILSFLYCRNDYLPELGFKGNRGFILSNVQIFLYQQRLSFKEGKPSSW